MLALSWLLVIPAIGALFVLFTPREEVRAIRFIALLALTLDAVLAIAVFLVFEPGGGWQFVERTEWVRQWGIYYHLGVDGISVVLVAMTAVLGWCAYLASWSGITTRFKEFTIVFLVLQGGMLGVFVARDLFLFYVFWEAMLIPMYFIIGMWGGPRRVYAATKFIIYTLLGSLLMLVAIIWLYFEHGQQSGNFTFDILQLMRTQLPGGVQMWLFAAFALAFAIKVPVFPFHTWLPDAHVEAPTAGSIILAGVLLKMGTYGLVRFCLPLFPAAAVQYAPLFAILGIIGILYGGMVCVVQRDLKRLIAYSSVSHLGFVVLGIFMLNQQGLDGAVLQMVNHGLSTGALFLLVGLIYERTHRRTIADLGGLALVMPVLHGVFLFIVLSSLGLPGLNNFVGEFLVLVGAVRESVWYAVAATGGVVLAAVYLLWMYQRVMHGQPRDEDRALPDLSLREWACLAPICVLILWLGLYPKPALERITPATAAILAQVRGATQHPESFADAAHGDAP